jgi:Uma2 family endonuclease
MNEQLRPAALASTTQAAEGLPRRRWSVAEIEAMVAQGIIAEDERFELIGGEVVPMSPKGARHELVKIALNRFFQRAAPEHLEIAQETTLRLDQDTFVEPDFCVFRRGPISRRSTVVPFCWRSRSHRRVRVRGERGL